MRDTMTTILFDTHCHINSEEFLEDYQAVIKRAEEVGVKQLLVIGCDRQSITQALKIASEYEHIYVAAAWHPVDVIDCKEEDKLFLETVWKHEKVIAVGETGLDYHWDKTPKELQQEYFEWHLDQSLKNNLPFIIHDREAHADVLETLQRYYKKYGPLNGIMHSYSGSVEMARLFLKLGLHLSISGVVTFKNAKNVKEVVQEIPLERLLIETDSPYLTPVPFRGKRNEPSYVKYVAKTVAELRGQSYETICDATTRNANALLFPTKK